eukprot:3477797-Pyramimonas_sp.AAC.1
MIKSTLIGDYGNLIVYNLHLPNTSDAFPLFAGVLGALQRDVLLHLGEDAVVGAHILPMGDWNFVLEEEGGLNGDGS